MAIFETLLPLKHNGREYYAGEEIELEDEYSTILLTIKAVKCVSRSGAPQEPAQAGDAGTKLDIGDVGAQTARSSTTGANGVSPAKGNSGGQTPPLVPDKFKEYAAKTNAEQIKHILEINDAAELEALLPYSKSRAKAAIERKRQELSA